MTSAPIQSRAPGKLVLIGEYAVLEGAPALAMAVDRFARVELTEGPDWIALGPSETEPTMPLIEGVLGLFDGARGGGKIDTRDFYHPEGGKLGLGSSAAASVALAGAVARRQGDALMGETGWRLLTKAHTSLQEGRGSGIDLACSFLGGVVRFELSAKRPAMDRLAWPAGLELCAVFTGESASTKTFLQRWSSWKSGERVQSGRVMEQLAQESDAGVAAFARGDVAGFLGAVEAYGRRLGTLGDAIAMPIVSPVHAAVRQVASELGLVYKPSGAGGGDVGTALGTEGTDWDRFSSKIRAIRGCEPLNLKLANDGLLVESTDER